MFTLNHPNNLTHSVAFEVARLKAELNEVKQQRDKLEQMVNSAGSLPKHSHLYLPIINWCTFVCIWDNLVALCKPYAWNNTESDL